MDFNTKNQERERVKSDHPVKYWLCQSNRVKKLGLFRFFAVFAILLGSFFVFGAEKASAATYYVDATGGNDSNSGVSTSQAWKTISKVNSSSFIPGDSVLFKKGEVWREQLVVPSSGTSGNSITLGSYGSGSRPKILASHQVSNFIAFKPNADFYSSWELGPNAGTNEGYGTQDEMSSGGSGTPGANMGWTVATGSLSVADSSSGVTPTLGTYFLKMDHNANVQKNFTSGNSEVYMEMAFRYTNNPSDYLVQFIDASNNPLGYFNPSLAPSGKGKIYVSATSSSVAVGNSAVSLNTWYKLKIHFKTDTTNGVAAWSMDSWNGSSWVNFDSASATGINTGTAQISKVRIMARQGSAGNYMYLDDVYINRGANDITASTKTDSSNIVVGYNSINVVPGRGFIDGKMRNVTTTFSSLGSNIASQSQFYGKSTSAKLIYVYPPSLPASSHTIEVDQPSVLADAVSISSKNYITIDGLEIGQSSNSAINISGGSDISIRNSYIRDGGIYGIYNDGSNNFNFSNNIVYGIRSWGIGVVSGSANITGGTVFENEVNQGYTPESDFVSWYQTGNDANGIVIEGASDASHSLSGVTVSRNWVHNCGHAGLWNHYAASIDWTHNLVTDVMLKDENWDNASMVIKNNLSGAGGNPIVNVYNNTFYNNSVNANKKYVIAILSTNGGTGTYTVNVKNNIISSTDTSGADACVGLAGNAGFPLTVNLSNNLYSSCKTNNLTYNTPNNIVTKNVGSGELSNSTDPKFVSSSNFSLQSNSPAINAGADLGSSLKLGLNPNSTWSSNIITLDQNIYGSGWEIGAYVYPESMKVNSPNISLKNSKESKKKIKDGEDIHYKKENIRLEGEDENMAGGTVKIYRNKSLIATIIADIQGAWKKTIKIASGKSPLLRVRQYNSFGTLISSKKTEVEVDTKKPEFTSFFWPFKSVTPELTNLSWNATDNEKISKYKIYLGGKIYTTKTTSFQIPREAPRGLQNITIRVYDEAGNSVRKNSYIRIN